MLGWLDEKHENGIKERGQQRMENIDSDYK